MHTSMEIYPRTAAEQAMKLKFQQVLSRATTGKIKWWQAAELIGIIERQMRRWRKRYNNMPANACVSGCASSTKCDGRRSGGFLPKACTPRLGLSGLLTGSAAFREQTRDV